MNGVRASGALCTIGGDPRPPRAVRCFAVIKIYFVDQIVRWLRELKPPIPNPAPLRATVAKIGPNPGLEATYTEHGSITSDNRENRSKSRTCTALICSCRSCSRRSSSGKRPFERPLVLKADALTWWEWLSLTQSGQRNRRVASHNEKSKRLCLVAERMSHA